MYEAKAEMERLKANCKITKNGRRNREKLLKSCKIISVAELLSFMEREKSNMRKLKRGYWREKKEVRQMNRKFQEVYIPTSVKCWPKSLKMIGPSTITQCRRKNRIERSL